jgi:hypothetical protein
MSGSAKGPRGCFEVNQANVYFDHPYHAPMDHALIINFVETPDEVGNLVVVELSKELARRLVTSILAALESGEQGHPVRIEVAASA